MEKGVARAGLAFSENDLPQCFQADMAITGIDVHPDSHRQEHNQYCIHHTDAHTFRTGYHQHSFPPFVQSK